MKKRQPRGISLIERAVIEKQVRETLTAAKAHAMSSEDSDEIVGEAGRMFYVVLGAAIADQLDPGMPEIHTLHAACDALYDQAGEDAVAADRRALISAGLRACEHLFGILDYDSVIAEALALHRRLKVGHLDWHAFEQSLQRLATT
ncbi:hypothetical protein VCH24_17150 [Variovorax boronicumulans]|nr:hypothetical protein VCH24_17150 [Variovorax boronicumulans]